MTAPVELDIEITELKQAIDSNDLEHVKSLMTRNPDLHRAPMGYGKNGPLTWVAECRIPWESPSAARLAMAQWMIDNGSDVHQGGDGPLMRAALVDHRIPMMELLVANGAEVNARWDGRFPIVDAPCETVEPAALKWLLDHGADPMPKEADANNQTALDYVIGTYSRSSRLGECIEVLLEAGCTTLRGPAVLTDMLRGKIDRVREHLDSDPALIHQRFPDFDFGSTGYRRLTLRGATLLHVAAEYGNIAAAELLLDKGADVNAPAEVDGAGVGGQTPLFHAVTQFYDWGLDVAKLLVKRGADLRVRARVPGHYEKPNAVVECTPFGYARMFPGNENETVTFLRGQDAPE